MPPSCALLGGFAIGVRVALLWQQREREMLASFALALCLVEYFENMDDKVSCYYMQYL